MSHAKIRAFATVAIVVSGATLLMSRTASASVHRLDCYDDACEYSDTMCTSIGYGWAQLNNYSCNADGSMDIDFTCKAT